MNRAFPDLDLDAMDKAVAKHTEQIKAAVIETVTAVYMVVERARAAAHRRDCLHIVLRDTPDPDRDPERYATYVLAIVDRVAPMPGDPK